MDDKMIDIDCYCPLCGKRYSLNVNAKEYYDGIQRYKNGELIQYAFPNFTISQRESIKTGICDDCWNNM